MCILYITLTLYIVESLLHNHYEPMLRTGGEIWNCERRGYVTFFWILPSEGPR